MKVMVLVKATEQSESGEFGPAEEFVAMGRFNEKLVEADDKRAREFYQRMAEYAAQLYHDDDAINRCVKLLKLNMPYYRESGIRYPFMILPASFGCYEVEVRREGVLQPRFADFGKQAVGGIAISGPPCGSIGFSSVPHFKGRLPLHLQYRFDQPGTYEVRLTMRRLVQHDVPFATDWTKVDILPADPAARQQWLADTVANAPTDSGDLLADFLPGILGHTP